MRKLAVLVLLGAILDLCQAQWVQTNGPDRFNVMALATSGTNLYAAAELGTTTWLFGVVRSTNQGESWSTVNNGLPTDFCYALAAKNDPAKGDFIFWGSLWGSGVFLSSDTGTHWSAGNAGLPYDSTLKLYLPVYSLFERGPDIFAGCRGGVFRSTNNGTSWTPTSLAFDVWKFAASGKYLFAGGGQSDPTTGIHVSTDSGANWAKVLDTHLADLAICESHLFAMQQIGSGPARKFSIHRSSDSGASWSLVDSTAAGGYFAVSGTHLFHCSYQGEVRFSADFAKTWTVVDGYIPYTNVNALVTDGTFLFAATGDGIWRRPLSEVLSVDQSIEGRPNSYTLEQNYPNPFNPSTTIRYELPKASMVRLSVFDILGREVSVLVNERENAGSYEVKYDGSNLASGVYLYRIMAGNYVETKKLLLIR